jgi:hypothetical protein
VPVPPLTTTTATTATSASVIPATASALGRSPPMRPTLTGSAAETSAVTGESTLIGPMARVRYSRANAAADVRPEAAPHPTAPGAKRAPTAGHSSSSTSRLTGAAMTTTRST